jgi:hypothetical protein
MVRLVSAKTVKEQFEEFKYTDSGSIEKMIANIVNQDDYLGLSPYIYVFAHKRELGLDERLLLVVEGLYKKIEDTPKARLIWCPRLTKPKAEPNSMLFRIELARPDYVHTIWILPERHLFSLYKRGKAFCNETIAESIDAYLNEPDKLEKKEFGDLSDENINKIYEAVSQQANIAKKAKEWHPI